MSDLSCVKCGRHFDAAAARCPECGHTRGEPVASWPQPILPGAERWQAQSAVRAEAPAASSPRELDSIFDDPSLDELHAPVEADILEIDDLDIAEDDIAEDDEKTVIMQAPVFASQPEPAPPVVERAPPAHDEPSFEVQSLAPLLASDQASPEAESPFDERTVIAPAPVPEAPAPMPVVPAQAVESTAFSWDDILAAEKIAPEPSGEIAPEAQLSDLPTAAALSARGPAIVDHAIDHDFTIDTAPESAPSAVAPKISAEVATPAPAEISGEISPDESAESSPNLAQTAVWYPPAHDSDEAAPSAGEVVSAVLAPLWQRVIAGMIDLIPVAGATAVALVALEPALSRAHLPLIPHSLDELSRMWWTLDKKMAILFGALFGSAMLYQLLTFVYMQGTVGDFLFGIVWITKRGRKPGLVRALWRALWLIPSFALFGTGYWFALLTQTKRPLYDWLSGVYPVKRKSIVV